MTDTFLRPEIFDLEINMTGFSVERADKECRVGGGVCLFINSKIKYKTLLSYSNSVCEVLVVSVDNPNVIIVNLYRPPSCSAAKFKDVLDKIKITLLSLCINPLPEVIFLGDLNFSGVDWDSLLCPGSQLENLISITDLFFLEQIIKKPTRYDNILDLVFMNPDIVDNTNIWRTKLSDHNIIKVNTLLPFLKTKSEKIINQVDNPFEKLNLVKCDWELLNQVDWDLLLDNPSVNISYDRFINKIAQECSECAPPKVRSLHRISPFRRKIKVLMRRRAKLRKRVGYGQLRRS